MTKRFKVWFLFYFHGLQYETVIIVVYCWICPEIIYIYESWSTLSIWI